MKYSEVKKIIEEGVVDSHPDLNLVNKTLHNLVSAGLLNKEDKERYVFKEQVTWEVVYETLLYSERRHLHDLIALHIEKNKEDEINQYASRLVYHYEKSENKKKTIYYCVLAGGYAYSLYAVDDALSFYRKARKILTSIKNYPMIDECALLEREADILEGIGSFPEAISLYKDALLIFEEANKTKRTFLPLIVSIKKQKSQLCHKLSVAYERIINYEDALKYLAEAEKNLPARPGWLPIKINATRGVIYFRKMEFDDSLKYAKKSLSIANRLNVFSDIAYAYNIIANIFMGTGKYNQAIESLKNALYQYENINDLTGVARTYFNMGVAYVNLYHVEDSDIYYNKALEIHIKLQDKLSVMYVYFMLAGNKIHKMDFDSAISLYNKVVSMYEDGVRRDDLYGVSLAKLAEIYSETNELEKAEQFITSSINVLSNLTQMPDKLLQARLVLAQLRMKQLKYLDAESICKDIIQVFSNSETTGMEIFIRRLLGTIYRDMEKYALAKQTLNTAHMKADEIGLEYEQYCIEIILHDIDAINGDCNNETLENVNKLLSIFKEKNDEREVNYTNNIIKKIKDKDQT